VNSSDFLLTCVGSGVLLVCVSWSIKILTDVRGKNHSLKNLAPQKHVAVEPIDTMSERLQEIRQSKFGVPMTVRGTATLVEKPKLLVHKPTFATTNPPQIRKKTEQK
jgi:hypothetical protein